MSDAVTAKEKAAAKNTEESTLWEWLKTVIYAVALALVIRTFILATFFIPTGSMEPTLRGAMNYGRGDRIVVIKFIYGIPIPFTGQKFLALTKPKRGDIVVFDTKGIPDATKKKPLIKRIVGVGGERLEIVPDNPYWNGKYDPIRTGGGHIHINGERLDEPAVVAERTYYPSGGYGSEAVDIPPGHYFMLGDNALNSRDSRFWGFVPRENVVGKAVLVWWPPNRIGLLN